MLIYGLHRNEDFTHRLVSWRCLTQVWLWAKYSAEMGIKMTEIAVIGGGASGLMSAVLCARRNKTVTIFEHNEKIGRKLLATGNGKCNFTNTNQDISYYHSENPDFIKTVLSQFGQKELFLFFREAGVLPKVKDGCCYPYSEQASAILDAFRFELEHLHVKIKHNEHVTGILKQKNGFTIETNTYTYEAKKVILACGGRAGKGLGADGSGYGLAKSLGHKITPLTPALTGMKSQEPYFTRLSGIRIKARASCCMEGELPIMEEGEIQLAAYGLSGIPIFQLSRHAALALLKGKKVEFILELLPDLKWEELHSFLLEQQEKNSYKTILMVLSSFMDKKLCQVLLSLASISSKALISGLSSKDIQSLCTVIKEWHIPIKEVNSYDKAQVTAGGVDTRQVNKETMESLLVKDLYLAGELLDADGCCGGYNLQWAFSTGYIAGLHASK